MTNSQPGASRSEPSRKARYQAGPTPAEAFAGSAGPYSQTGLMVAVAAIKSVTPATKQSSPTLFTAATGRRASHHVVLGSPRSGELRGLMPEGENGTGNEEDGKDGGQDDDVQRVEPRDHVARELTAEQQCREGRADDRCRLQDTIQNGKAHTGRHVVRK